MVLWKADIERVFVVKSDLTDEDRARGSYTTKTIKTKDRIHRIRLGHIALSWPHSSHSWAGNKVVTFPKTAIISPILSTEF